MLLYPYEKEEKEVEGHLFSMNMQCFLFRVLYFFEKKTALVRSPG
jgi:hypothetical protein